MGKIQLIGGRAHPLLARKIAKLIKTPLAPIEIKTFAVDLKKKEVIEVDLMEIPLNEKENG